MPSQQMKKFEHIDYPLVAEVWLSSPMYNMHKYWARKPPNVVAKYIEAYSQPNDIVLDPFCGSGPVIFESIKMGRKVVGVDLNPVATFLIDVTARNIDLAKFKNTFEEMQDKTKSKIDKLYSIDCPTCHQHRAIASCIVWSYTVKCPNCSSLLNMNKHKRAPKKRQNIYVCSSCRTPFSYANVDIEGEVPVAAVYDCVHCGHRAQKLSEDADVGSSIRKSFRYPDLRFYYPNKKPFRTKRRANDFLELFTKRNLYALSLIYEEITKVKDDDVRDLLFLTFSSTTPQASRMMIWTKESGPSWKIPEYLIFHTHCELNVWDRFANRYRSILSGKKQANNDLKLYKPAVSFNELLNDKTALLNTGSALDLSFIPDNSIDYVFTDPPYGGAIQYYELGLVRSAWFSRRDPRFNLDWWKDEITINENQGKDFDRYHNMLSTAFAQIYKKLKAGKYMTVTFHSTDIEVYNSIIRAPVTAGFEIESIVYQLPSTVSVKQQAQPYGSAVGDYYIRFKKPIGIVKEKKDVVTADLQARAEAIIINAVKAIIAERGDPTTYTDLLRRIYVELDRAGFLLVSKPQQIQDVIKKGNTQRFGAVFTSNLASR